ncbi:MAG: HAF repeat-containing protein [Gemmatimonadales bacterium]
MSGKSELLLPLLVLAAAMGATACSDEATAPSGIRPDLATTATGYRAIDLGTLGGSFSIAFGINRSGQVVGESHIATGRSRAFLWSGGTMRDLGTLGGNFARAFGISDGGKVVGSAATGSGQHHAFLWSAGVMRDLGTLGGGFSQANAINSAVQVVGLSSTAASTGLVPVNHAFIWQNGVMRDLGTLGGDYSQAYGINPLGQVVGESETADGRIHAFVWANGVMTDLGPTGGKSQAFAINRSGRVGGSSAKGPRATIWVDGQRRLWGPSGEVSAIFGLNAAGLAVGVSQMSGENRAALWIKGTMSILPALAGGNAHGQAFAINREKRVVGASTTTTGQEHATLWIPQE